MVIGIGYTITDFTVFVFMVLLCQTAIAVIHICNGSSLRQSDFCYTAVCIIGIFRDGIIRFSRIYGILLQLLGTFYYPARFIMDIAQLMEGVFPGF